jgi:hypothetical protein
MIFSTSDAIVRASAKLRSSFGEASASAKQAEALLRFASASAKQKISASGQLYSQSRLNDSFE